MFKLRVNFGIFVNISRSSVSYSSNGISRILKKASLSKFVILTFAAKMSLLNDIAGTVQDPKKLLKWTLRASDELLKKL